MLFVLSMWNVKEKGSKFHVKPDKDFAFIILRFMIVMDGRWRDGGVITNGSRPYTIYFRFRFISRVWRSMKRKEKKVLVWREENIKKKLLCFSTNFWEQIMKRKYYF